MITYVFEAKPKTVKQADLSSVSDVTLYTATDAIESMLDSVVICNKTGAGVAVDVWITSGGNTYVLKGKSIQANDTLKLNDINIRLENGAVLKARAGAATSLDIWATLLEFHRNTGR